MRGIPNANTKVSSSEEKNGNSLLNIIVSNEAKIKSLKCHEIAADMKSLITIFKRIQILLEAELIFWLVLFVFTLIVSLIS